MKKRQGVRQHLTSERLGKRFGNMFDLVKYAKRVAEGMVNSGRAPEDENVAMRILEDIATHREKLITPEQVEAHQRAMDAVQARPRPQQEAPQPEPESSAV